MCQVTASQLCEFSHFAELATSLQSVRGDHFNQECNRIFSSIIFSLCRPEDIVYPVLDPTNLDLGISDHRLK